MNSLLRSRNLVAVTLSWLIAQMVLLRSMYRFATMTCKWSNVSTKKEEATEDLTTACQMVTLNSSEPMAWTILRRGPIFQTSRMRAWVTRLGACRLAKLILSSFCRKKAGSREIWMKLFLTLTTGFCRLRATLTIRVSRSEEASLVEPILEGQTCCSRWSSHRQMRPFVRKVRAVPYKLIVSTIVFAAKIDSVWN